MCDDDYENCKLWDEDCRVVDLKLESDIRGVWLMPSCSPCSEGPSRKKAKLSINLNKSLISLKDDLKKNWGATTAACDDQIELITNPFKVCLIKSLLQDPSLIKNLTDEFNELEWNKRTIDLYDFFQSVDLKHIYSPYIRKMYEFLEHEVMKFVGEVTQTNLKSISATCSRYGDSDYLLVHDDRRGDRVIAFIFYLMPQEWNEDMGGALQLLAKDKHGQPSSGVRNIVPINNQFIFFEVTNDSYHQVLEVTTKNYCRLSINGWFHGPRKPSPPVLYKDSFGLFSNRELMPLNTEIDLNRWLSDDYLDPDTMTQIQAQIEGNSEISLNDFFKEEEFDSIVHSLHNVKWTPIGPPNRRNYKSLIEENLPEVLESFLGIFKSQTFFDLLKQYTDLELRSFKYEMQKWTPGCYSLLSDYDWNDKKELDVIAYFNCNSGIVGGQTLYVSLEDAIQEALITLEPIENCLNIVYRDTARFTKYFSKCSAHRCFYKLICSYSE